MYKKLRNIFNPATNFDIDIKYLYMSITDQPCIKLFRRREFFFCSETARRFCFGSRSLGAELSGPNIF